MCASYKGGKKLCNNPQGGDEHTLEGTEMLGQLVLGRAINSVAQIDLACVASERCARRERHLRWLNRCRRVFAAKQRQRAAEIPNLLAASAAPSNQI